MLDGDVLPARPLRGFGDLTVVGIEGTGSYGVGLTRFLLEAGVELREVLRPGTSGRPMNFADLGRLV